MRTPPTQRRLSEHPRMIDNMLITGSHRLLRSRTVLTLGCATGIHCLCDLGHHLIAPVMVGANQQFHLVRQRNTLNPLAIPQDRTISRRMVIPQQGTIPMTGTAGKCTTEVLGAPAFHHLLPHTRLPAMVVHQQRAPTVMATTGTSPHNTDHHSHTYPPILATTPDRPRMDTVR